MRALNLNLHTGGNEVDYAAVSAVSLPERTESYVPVPHATLFGMVRDTVTGAGLSVLNEVHALNRGGKHYFAMMEVGLTSLENTVKGFVVGLRNSYDKSLAAAMVAGDCVFVCSNLAFSGEYKLSRKHTVNVFADLPNMIASTVANLPAVWQSGNDRMNRYAAAALTDTAAHDTIAKLWRNGALLKTEISTAIDEWHKPSHPEFEPRTLWSLQNAATEAWKGGRLDTLSERSLAMYRTLDAVLA